MRVKFHRTFGPVPAKQVFDLAEARSWFGIADEVEAHPSTERTFHVSIFAHAHVKGAVGLALLFATRDPGGEVLHGGNDVDGAELDIFHTARTEDCLEIPSAIKVTA